MPGYDQMGPEGEGPKTGRGLGPCFKGMTWTRGHRRGYGKYAGRSYLSRKEELESMEEEASCLEADLKVLKEEIAQIKNE